MSPEAAHHPHVPGLAHHFDSLEQQTEATTLGMWVFLATEVMFFGVLFFAALHLRLHDPAGYAAGSRLTHAWLGTINTALLLTSSLAMALGVRAARLAQPRPMRALLLVTAALGAAFLAVKAAEYALEWRDGLVPGVRFGYAGPEARGVQSFFFLYFVMTGLHAVHMLIGFGIMLFMLGWTWKGTITADYYSPIEIAGLYWHFVDIVWIFLFPLLYLLGGRGH